MNMGLVSVPNLDYGSALAFCREFETYKWDEENIFDFKKVYNCDPFPMLCVGSKIRKRRSEHSELACKAQNLHNDYATNMRFYRFIGIDKGRQLDLEYGNGNYQPISDLNLLNVLKESRQLNKPVGELVTNISEKLATVLARDDKIVKKTMTFCLREIIRNIPEHSNSLNGWYCAQYWPTKDLVELAIIDDGRGILESINSNYNYASESINSDLSVKIRGDIVRFCMVESQDQVKHEMTKQEAQALVKYNDDIKNHRWASKPQIRKYDKVYNGKLRIVFGARSYIRDNDSEKLEDRLGDILVTLYEKAEENRIVREAREEAERKRVEEERRREENRQRKEQEIRLVKELVNKAEDYRIAKEIREYIQAMIDSGNEDITPEWIEWALKKADWYDPSIATEDEYLGKRQHEKSAEEKEKSLQDSIRKSWYW